MTRTSETSASWTNAPRCSTGGLWQKSRFCRRSGVSTVTTCNASGEMATPVSFQHFTRVRLLRCLAGHLVAAGESKLTLALTGEGASDHQQAAAQRHQDDDYSGGVFVTGHHGYLLLHHLLRWVQVVAWPRELTSSVHLPQYLAALHTVAPEWGIGAFTGTSCRQRECLNAASPAPD